MECQAGRKNEEIEYIPGKKNGINSVSLRKKKDKQRTTEKKCGDVASGRW